MDKQGNIAPKNANEEINSRLLYRFPKIFCKSLGRDLAILRLFKKQLNSSTQLPDVSPLRLQLKVACQKSQCRKVVHWNLLDCQATSSTDY